jgi:hypothetical protein
LRQELATTVAKVKELKKDFAAEKEIREQRRRTNPVYETEESSKKLQSSKANGNESDADGPLTKAKKAKLVEELITAVA